MLDLLKGIENLLLLTLLSISAGLTITAILTAVILSVRRIYRNKRAGITLAHEKRFEAFLQKKLGNADIHKDLDLPDDLREDHAAIATILLKFFKIIKGEDSTLLKMLVDDLHLEPIIVAATRKGNRGKRMRAYNVLSFLDTRSSLLTIADQLYSEDKYIRLSVARCLGRRKVMSLLPEVAESISTAFPKDEKLVADVLLRFGRDAIPQLEQMILRSKSNTIKAGALEALILLRPAKIDLDLLDLMESPDARIRAATVDFSTICEHASPQDILLLGLGDASQKVKIRSLKVAQREQRQDAFSHLYRLISDPNLWVRYWAMRAAVSSGKSGETLMRTLARHDGLPGILAGKIMLEGDI